MQKYIYIFFLKTGFPEIADRGAFLLGQRILKQQLTLHLFGTIFISGLIRM